MELSDEQRDKLAEIVKQGDYITYARDKRRTPKEAYEQQRKRLETLISAWNAIDHDTQVEITYGIYRMWEDRSDDASFPDLLIVVSDLLLGMEMSPRRPEQIAGLTRATKFLWEVWCDEQLGGKVAIGREAIDAIAPEVASLFKIKVEEAKRRVRNALRALEKTEEGLERR